MAATNTLYEQDIVAITSSGLFGSDFDGTKFRTGESAPGILTVNEAYAEGIASLVGSALADVFLDQGGHNHRTAPVIIKDLCPDMPDEDVESTSASLVEAKMQLFNDQIGRTMPDGSIWPRPTDGFVECWDRVGDLRRKNPLAVVTADLSAGHVSFIVKTYDVHGLERPDMIVTDETLTGEHGMQDVLPVDREKPAPLLMEVAHKGWLTLLGVDAGLVNDQTSKDRVIYAGDSPEKDGGLAANHGVEFVLINTDSARPDWERVNYWLRLGVAGLAGARS